MIKGIERVTPMIQFELKGVESKLHGVRQDSPPKITLIEYELIVDTAESANASTCFTKTSVNTSPRRTP